MATAAKAIITAEEFMAMDLGEGTFELVRGEVIELPPAMPEHGLVCGNTAIILGTYGRQTGYGYMLCNDSAVQTERGPDTVRGADVSFYSQARWPRSEVGRRLPPIAPDLVVEVFSPGNRAGEMLGKVQEYLDAGVLMVWVIHPVRRTLAIYRPDDPTPTVLTATDTLENLPELPGFRCPVAEFFV
ncbi:MAG: Uma2 family endonuclease [Isosphaeraceae bacterium]